MYEYKAKVLRVVDGDTVDVDIDLGFGVWMHRERVRMMGIDTPESRTRDKVEKAFGLHSKKPDQRIVTRWIAQCLKKKKKNKSIKVEKIKRKVSKNLETPIDGKRATDILIEEGHAVAYFGGSKEEVEAKHMANRERLLNEGKVTLPK